METDPVLIIDTRAIGSVVRASACPSVCVMPVPASKGHDVFQDAGSHSAVTPRPLATATQHRGVPKTRLRHALGCGPIWTPKGPSRISPKQPLTCGDAGGRYWDRTSDLFRVRDRKHVRRGPPACVCEGQSAVGPQADIAGWGRTSRGWGTRWGTRRAGRQVAWEPRRVEWQSVCAERSRRLRERKRGCVGDDRMNADEGSLKKRTARTLDSTPSPRSATGRRMR